MDIERIASTDDDRWRILVRLAVGLVVFFPEGIQKLAFADLLGAGRFARIGIPWPDAMGPFVGCVDIICGELVHLGLFTRLAVISLILTLLLALFPATLTLTLRT